MSGNFLLEWIVPTADNGGVERYALPITSLAPWLVWLCRRSHVFWQLEPLSLRPFESTHPSLLCTPADSLCHGSAVSSLLYRIDDSFQGAMKNILALKLFIPIFTVDKFCCHSDLTGEGKKGDLVVVLIMAIQGTHWSYIHYQVSAFATICCSPSLRSRGKEGLTRNRRMQVIVQRKG